MSQSMPSFDLPERLPAIIDVNGKKYRRIGGTLAVKLNVARGNDGSWHYYFPSKYFDEKGNVVGPNEQEVGIRRHFSVHTAYRQRSVHISMKAHDEKKDDIQIWYCYDECWDGRKNVRGWGRTTFYGKDATRVSKAVELLRKFLQAMTDVAKGTVALPVQPTPSPPITYSVPQSVSPPLPSATADHSSFLQQRTVPDSWEDIEC